MKRGAKPGVRRVDAGVPRPRNWGPEPLPLPPEDPVEVALNGSFRRGDVDEAEWAQLRVAAWERWLELVSVDEEEKTADFRDPPRGPTRAWPPKGALHDGIEGKVLRSYWNPPEGYISGWDARPKIVELADQGLEEVAAFRKREPAAAEAISKPLAELERRLRKVRDPPGATGTP